MSKKYRAKSDIYNPDDYPYYRQPGISKTQIKLPPKTIRTMATLEPPYANLSIDPNEEVIDLDELRKYGRYAIIVEDTPYKKKFLLSHNIIPAKDIENPEYVLAIKRVKLLAEREKAREDMRKELNYKMKNKPKSERATSRVDEIMGTYTKVPKLSTIRASELRDDHVGKIMTIKYSGGEERVRDQASQDWADWQAYTDRLAAAQKK